MSRGVNNDNTRMVEMVEDLLRKSDKEVSDNIGETVRILVLSVMELHKTVSLLRREVQMLRWFIGTLIVMIVVAMVQTLFK